MSAISLKSITGITSITTPAGVDNQLTLHTNNTTERVKIDIAGNVHINNHLAVAGVTTAAGNITISSSHPKLLLTDDTNPDFSVHVNSGSFHIRNETVNRNDFRITSDGTNELYYAGIKKLETTNTGIIVTGDATFSGKVSVGATITYEDVTNVDSVGIITARQGVRVPNGSATSNYISVGNNGALRFWATTHSFGDIRSGNLHFRNNSLQNILEIQQDKDIFLYGPSYFLDTARFDSTVTIADSIIHFGDTDTKIRFPAVDTISFETAGSERLRIDSNGRVLIGTTTEGYTSADDLTVATTGSTGITIRSGTANLGTIAYSDGTSGDAEYRGYFQYDHNGDFLKIGIAGAEKVRIHSNGSMTFGKTTSAGKAIEIYQTAFAALRIQNSSTGTGNNDGILLEASGSDCLLYNYEAANLKLGTSGTERLVITSGGHVNIGGDYTQTTYGFSVRGGAVDQSTRFSNTKSSNGDIHYIGISLTNNGFGQALFGHTGHTTAGSQAAWMGLGGDDVAGGVGVKCYRGGTVQMGASSTLQAFINNSVSGHQFISQCSDNNNGFEIYQKHGSTGTRKTLAVYANTGNSAAKQIQFEVRGDNTTHAYGTKNTSTLTLSTAIGPSGAHSYGDENRLDFSMYNEIPQFTGNPAARIAGYLQRGNNGFGLRFYARANAGTLFKAMEITADYEVLPGSNGTVDLGNASNRWKNVYTSDLDLSNEAKGGNDVDGTWGSYTIQEGESDLFLINKRNGKKYKFNLTEVS